MSRSSRTIHLLHVDDDLDLAEVAADFLTRYEDRITVVTAESASEGLDLLAETPCDCVVSDYDMPGQNGIEFLERVREDWPDLPFILFTGKGSEEVASEAISAAASDYLQKETGSEQYELLANRICNCVEQYRARQRAGAIDRLRSIARAINQALVRTMSRPELESRVCEIICNADPYLFAWVGEFDHSTGTVVARTGAGLEEGYLDAIEITTDDTPTGHGPTARAIRTHEVAVMQDIRNDSEYEPWRDEALERGYHASAAIPLVYDETMFGVLSVYADRSDAFDDRERDLLTEIGTDIGHAIHSFEVQRDLREEREFIDQALDALDDVFYVLDPDGNVDRWNKRLLEVTGYTLDELDGMAAVDLFPEDEQQRVSQAVEETLTDGMAIVEAELLAKDGVRIPYEFTGSRLTDADGTRIGLIGIGRDVTGRSAEGG